MQLIYQTVTEEFVSVPKNCNTNNHRISDGIVFKKLKDIRPEEYIQTLAKTNKNEWNKYFPDPPGTIKIELSVKHCRILRDASLVGFLKFERPALYKEELEELESYIRPFLPSHPFFIRIKECSAKDGVHGCGPFYNEREIVTALSTSLKINKAMDVSLSQGNILYIIPWRNDYNKLLEFRVFVNHKKVTAISQYEWFRHVGLNRINIEIITKKILEFCNNSVIAIFPPDSYVIDLIVIVDNPIIENENLIPKITDSNIKIELIEFNSFGAEYSSGSCLFHWLNDYDILYGTDGNVYIRYVF